jgi:hypothetical protein
MQTTIALLAGLLATIAVLAGAALVRGLLHRRRTEHEFNKLFMTTSKEGKEALIQRWTDMKKCSRDEAMRLAMEEWRRENRSWR